MSPEAFHESCVPRASALAKLRSDAESPAAPTNEHTLFCFTSDAYQPGATITREALTIMGRIGIKVWVYHGELLPESIEVREAPAPVAEEA